MRVETDSQAKFGKETVAGVYRSPKWVLHYSTQANFRSVLRMLRIVGLCSGSAQVFSGSDQVRSPSAQVWSPSAQVKAAAAHVRRLKRNERIWDYSPTFVVATQSLSCCLSTCRRELILTLRCTMVQRVRTAAGVLPGNFLKIQSQGLPSVLYTSKRCSSIGSLGGYLLLHERPCFSASLEYPSSSLLRSGLLSLKSR
jgi:hypothetical protein